MHSHAKRWMRYGLVLIAGTAVAAGCERKLVTDVADYLLSLAPAALTIVQGANGGTAVTITRTNFSGAVTLSLSGAPAGVTGSFIPTAPTANSATLTIGVGATVAPGIYNLTVAGAGAPGDRSTPLTLTVAVAPNYALSLAPAALTIVQGSNGGTTVTITRTNFTGAVTLSLSGAPAGVTASFNPAAPTGTSSTLTVSVGAAVAPGVYNLSVDGTAAPGNRSTSLTLTVSAAPPDYTLSLAPAALTVAPGGNVPTTVNIGRTNFSGAVTLSLGNAPAGITGSFNPPAPAGNSSTLTVSVAASVADGVYNLTVDGTGSAGDRSTALTLTVSTVPDYALSLTPATLTIVQGTNGNATVNINRSNFTGTVTLSLGGAPAGVTGSFNPAAPTGNSSTLTVSVGAAVAPGIYNLTVDGSATPGNRSTPLTLTVNAAPADYALSLSSAALTIIQGANGNTTVNINRTNFTGAVTLSLGNAPAGVTGSFNPAAPTGNSSTLTVSVAASVAAGTYNLTVDGTGTPGNRSTPLTLTVNSSGGVNVTVDFSSCAVADRAVWLAYQDGTGPWNRVTGVNDVYTFSITSGKGGLTYVLVSTTSDVEVLYMTQAEFTARPLVFCGPSPTGKSVTGTVAGVDATQAALISLGGGATNAFSFSPNFTINGVKDGTHDLVASRTPIDASAGPDGVIVQRDLNVPNNGSVGTLDFAGVQSFAPVTATVTVGGLVGGEALSHSMGYQVGATCDNATLYRAAPTAASFTAYGIPAAQQRASDFHSIFIADTGSTGLRSVTESFHTLAARTVTLGAPLPTPAVTDLGGPYKRLQVVYMLPADYQTSTSFAYRDGASKSVNIIASFGYLGGAAVNLSLADYSGVSGWDNAWPPAATSSGDWDASGLDGTLTGSACTEGARFRIASKTGSF